MTKEWDNFSQPRRNIFKELGHLKIGIQRIATSYRFESRPSVTRVNGTSTAKPPPHIFGGEDALCVVRCVAASMAMSRKDASGEWGNINVVVVRQEQHTCKKLLNRSYSNAAAAAVAAQLHNAGIGNIAA